jgi:hypothetical protein
MVERAGKANTPEKKSVPLKDRDLPPNLIYRDTIGLPL